jgi:hypothetical protein
MSELDGGSNGSLAGQLVFVAGRLQGLTRARLDHLVARQGGRVTRRASPRTTRVVVTHTATELVRQDGTLCLPAVLPTSAVLLGEIDLRRHLGLSAAEEDEPKTLDASEVERLSGLSATMVATLALFDVLSPDADRFGYRDVVAAREVSRLLKTGMPFPRVLEAAVDLGRRGHHLAGTRLVEGPSGELFRDVAGRIAELSGQFTMSLPGAAPSVDELFAAAERAGEAEDWAAAEGLYSTALRADQNDPVLPFNLGNVYDAQGRSAEAKIAWQIAAARDPAFAEAWYNLAVAAEDDGLEDLAIAQYRRAAEARPDYADANQNLALLLTRRQRYAEALPLWDGLLTLDIPAEQRDLARRAATLCRLELAQAPSKTG